MLSSKKNKLNGFIDKIKVHAFQKIITLKPSYCIIMVGWVIVFYWDVNFIKGVCHESSSFLSC